jgi:GNAT superfamily N-acetyltransferase
VYDGPTCVGWCQFGTTDELPRIKLKRAYLEGLTDLPHWRITCFFVDREHRGKGVAAAALKGALREIARLGGGTVESYPEDVEGRSVSGSFLYNATVSVFEREGFRRTRRLGTNHWVVTKVVRRSSRRNPP